MRKAMVPLTVILSVMTILLAAVWMRYARDIKELETRVDSLPAYDQALLREGLAARDEAELTKILQDYES